MKDSFYFPHDYNAHNDPKLVRLSMAGWDLIGLYWAIVGMLHEQGGWMPNDPKTHAFALRVKEDRIALVINFPDLFIIKDGMFTSHRVLNNLAKRHEKREKAQLSALKRWDNANAMRTHSEGNARKESKERKTDATHPMPSVSNNTTTSDVFDTTVLNKAVVFNFEDIWSKYPNKDGKKNAMRYFKASVLNEKDMDDIHTALSNYLNSERVKKGYIKNGSTWFNNWRDWIDYKDYVLPQDEEKELMREAGLNDTDSTGSKRVY